MEIEQEDWDLHTYDVFDFAFKVLEAALGVRLSHEELITIWQTVESTAAGELTLNNSPAELALEIPQSVGERMAMERVIGRMRQVEQIIAVDLIRMRDELNQGCDDDQTSA